MAERDSGTQRKRLLAFMREHPVLRARDLKQLGVPRAVLARLVAANEIQRVARGLYTLSDADVSIGISLAQAQARVPRGVVCLLSALRFHELTTQNPFEVWMAIDRKARRPNVDYPPLRFVRFSAPALRQGIEVHNVDGVRVKITTPARTVADCFKYRNKIGVDVAIEALRDYRSQKAGTMDDLWQAAKLNRVARVMDPYLKAIL